VNPPEINIRGRKVCVELMYPRSDENCNAVEVDMCDVRATDGLLISYDFDRNGWSIKQASTFSWEANDSVMDSDWQEVAFIQSWAREITASGTSNPEE
jgi:hypothetical protein